MSLEKIMDLLEAGKYTIMDDTTTPIWFYDFIFKNGGKVRIIHLNKVLWVKEAYTLIVFVPDKQEPVAEYKIKSDNAYFNRINEIFLDAILKEESNNYDKYFR